MDNKNKLYHVFEVCQDCHHVKRITNKPVSLETNWEEFFQKDNSASTRLTRIEVRGELYYHVVKCRYYTDNKVVLDIVDSDGRTYLVEYDGASKTITQCDMTSVDRRDVKPSNAHLKALLEICVSYAKKTPCGE